MGPHRNSSDFHPSHTLAVGQWLLSASEEGGGGVCGGGGDTHSASKRSRELATDEGEGPLNEWNGAQCGGTALTQLPSSRTSAASLFTLTGSRLRAKISSHFLTEGQRDTVLRMNGHVMLSML